MEDGWYLMNTSELERVLAEWRRGSEPSVPPGVRQLFVAEAMAYRNAGNLPDEQERSLRLVLHVSDDDVAHVAQRRLVFEPDFHDAPVWKKPGSRSVNVVPLRTSGADGTRMGSGPWWEEPGLQGLEEEWARTGMVAGLRVPADYRGFVFKTVVALRGAGRDITADSVADSIARWLPDGAETIRAALKEKEPGQKPGSP